MIGVGYFFNKIKKNGTSFFASLPDIRADYISNSGFFTDVNKLFEIARSRLF